MKTSIINKKEKKAFTLIEIILYVSVLSICIGAMAMFMDMVSSAKTKNKMILEVERQGENIVYIIQDEITSSQSVISPMNASLHTELQLESSDASLNPIVFKESAGILSINYSNGDDIPLNGGAVRIDNLEFNRLDNTNSPETIVTSFTLSTGAGLGRSEFIYKRDFSFATSRRY